MTNNNPRRGEIWDVNFDPQVGDEIQKIRPAMVISIPAGQKLQLRIVVPFTDWKPEYKSHLSKVEILPTAGNGLIKASAADAFQVKSVSIRRFYQIRGVLTPQQSDEISEAVGVIIGVIR